VNAWLAILEDNDCARNNSFLYYLHEKRSFDVQSFWLYYNALVGLTDTNQREKTLDRAISRMVSNTYSYAIGCFLWHLCPYDGYEMRQFPCQKLHLYIDRLRTAADGYFAGYVLDESHYADDLKNPLA
jgi:hypothetical protein